MPQEKWKSLCVVVVLSSALQGCAHSRVSEPPTTCLTDPKNLSLQCKDKTVRFNDAYNWVCFPVDEFKKYDEGCE